MHAKLDEDAPATSRRPVRVDPGDIRVPDDALAKEFASPQVVGSKRQAIPRHDHDESHTQENEAGHDVSTHRIEPEPDPCQDDPYSEHDGEPRGQSTKVDDIRDRIITGSHTRVA